MHAGDPKLPYFFQDEGHYIGPFVDQPKRRHRLLRAIGRGLSKAWRNGDQLVQDVTRAKDDS